MVITFFIVLWAAALWILGHLSRRHSWFIPIFAIGLGSPRWCQMMWSTSTIGYYIPWAGGPVASALLGRGLWLWLGVLDAIQGVGKLFFKKGGEKRILTLIRFRYDSS